MDGSDVFLTYLAVGMLLLLCFFYACCTNLKEDCTGAISPEAYNPCAKEDFMNSDLQAEGLYDPAPSYGGERYMDNVRGSCDV